MPKVTRSACPAIPHPTLGFLAFGTSPGACGVRARSPLTRGSFEALRGDCSIVAHLATPAVGKMPVLEDKPLDFRRVSCIKRVQSSFPPTAPAIVERRFVRFSGLSGANQSPYRVRQGRSGQLSNARQLFH
jgi:hypothetical protein